MSELRTARLILRQWRDTDLAPLAVLNADPEVMRHFPAPLTRAASDALVTRERARLDERGWGLWAVEVTPTQETRASPSDTTNRRATDPMDLDGGCIGFVGLAEPSFDAHFTPAVEVGWRLARSAWGHGYATEAACAAVTFGLGELGLREIVSFTTVANVRSRRVMERLGMIHDPADDFDHPGLVGSSLAPHVLYRTAAASS